ncbi:hypothetical protein BOTBODRAFT_439102 [Botryobasidium botryosum FD-172 SS1]|uniref:F-box domain-containing protein n=1 Tax=Botryobasidium botryosum (strain FD-172 SS1) TaxID=930990 RepID=A0A067MUK4_BOTB1|nr:hypothetical protein BOTBODRAFT_439102 [Botryobasidium botryosum FD-172 SS1]
MARDALCIISGIRPGGGPNHLFSRSEEERVLGGLAEEIAQTSQMEADSVYDILNDAISSLGDSHCSHDDDADQLYEWPHRYENWQFFSNCVAVGHFDGDGGPANVLRHHSSKIPSGRHIEVRRVCEDDGGYFSRVIVDASDPGGEPSFDGFTRVKWRPTDCDPVGGNPNVFALEGPFRYLEAWVDRDSLPDRRLAFPNDPEPMSFESEFYEIVNTRAAPRRERDGTLPCIKYGGIEKTWERTQDFFLPALQGSKHVRRAILEGLRGADLLPALMRDFGCWMCVRPDVWPCVPEPFELAEYKPFAIGPETVPGLTPFHTLPTELCLRIFHFVPISSLLSLASSCRSLRALLGQPGYLDRVVREAIIEPDGQLRWILPVASMGERQSVESAAWAWLPEDTERNDDDLRRPVDPFLSPNFPHLAFLRACYESESMMNRRRYWDIAKQFEALWADYRIRGREREVTYPLEHHCRPT